MQQKWNVILEKPVLNWLETLGQNDLLRIYAGLELLTTEGPQLGRPYADTIQGSKYTNLKELRIRSRTSVFRLFFIFDPIRQAIVLCGGDKKGKNQKHFYSEMIALAEQTYEAYLIQLEKEQANDRKL
ncbi:diaminopimelate decarboxylase [Pasteurellaceae bacterium LFhippo2]|nr:diaminopimelate decarboxylase [Pasteurellaceae bacterium LFhippo2]